MIADLVFPQGLYCNCCGKYIDKNRTYGLCDHCIRHMNFNVTKLSVSETPQLFDGAIAAMGYGTYERRLIFSLKYDGRTYVAPVIAQILYDALLKVLKEEGSCQHLLADVVVPVPVSRKRLRERGFNQTEKIAKHFCKRSGIKMTPNALLRTKDTVAQRALSAFERQQNMRGVFSVNPKSRHCIEGKSVLLLDDIYTTGATAKECCQALRKGGASKVYFLSLLAAENRHHEFCACNMPNKW